MSRFFTTFTANIQEKIYCPIGTQNVRVESKRCSTIIVNIAEQKKTIFIRILNSIVAIRTVRERA